MDMLAKIYGKENNMQTLAAEIKEHAESLSVLERDLAKLLELQAVDPERSMEMDGRIYVAGVPMAISAEIPIVDLVRSKRREIDRVVGIFNRTAVAMNEASVRLNNFVPDPPRPQMPKAEPLPETPAEPAAPAADLQTDAPFKFESVGKEEVQVRRSDVKAEMQRPLVGGFRGFRK